MNGIHEVRGSIPLISTKTKTCLRQVFSFWRFPSDLGLHKFNDLAPIHETWVGPEMNVQTFELGRTILGSIVYQIVTHQKMFVM